MMEDGDKKVQCERNTRDVDNLLKLVVKNGERKAEYERNTRDMEDLFKLVVEDRERKLQCERKARDVEDLWWQSVQLRNSRQCKSQQVSKLNTDMPDSICNYTRFKFFMMC